MKRLPFLICAIFLFGGCTYIKHMPQLLAMKRFGDNGDLKDRLVEEHNHAVNVLIDDIKAGRLEKGLSPRDIRKTYTDPLMARRVVRDGKEEYLWLYREATDFFDADKVYLFFGEDEKLTDWVYIPKEELAEKDLAINREGKVSYGSD